ncbi:hypothetical protein [Natronosalvus rutilus]|uniref:Uncharacterized protein n=1 Tax=Natronosalvus rutilus TaxID=2953753 RepID=A0A9E7SX56_9EURY|nr:hypothetical protein [Natronosalvus rutilus]UTF53833.1 hypothetical protein NGM29_00680 [Natronosalvus rutilus]
MEKGSGALGSERPGNGSRAGGVSDERSWSWLPTRSSILGGRTQHASAMARMPTVEAAASDWRTDSAVGIVAASADA